MENMLKISLNHDDIILTKEIKLHFLETFNAVDILYQVKRIIPNLVRELSEEYSNSFTFNPIFLEDIYYLKLSDRLNFALDRAKIFYIGQLVQKRESELLRISQIGQLSLNELKKCLHNHNLTLGTKITNFEQMKTRKEIEKESSC